MSTTGSDSSAGGLPPQVQPGAGGTPAPAPHEPVPAVAPEHAVTAPAGAVPPQVQPVPQVQAAAPAGAPAQPLPDGGAAAVQVAPAPPVDVAPPPHVIGGYWHEMIDFIAGGSAPSPAAAPPHTEKTQQPPPMYRDEDGNWHPAIYLDDDMTELGPTEHDVSSDDVTASNETSDTELSGASKLAAAGKARPHGSSSSQSPNAVANASVASQLGSSHPIPTLADYARTTPPDQQLHNPSPHANGLLDCRIKTAQRSQLHTSTDLCADRNKITLGSVESASSDADSASAALHPAPPRPLGDGPITLDHVRAHNTCSSSQPVYNSDDSDDAAVDNIPAHHPGIASQPATQQRDGASSGHNGKGCSWCSWFPCCSCCCCCDEQPAEDGLVSAAGADGGHHGIVGTSVPVSTIAWEQALKAQDTKGSQAWAQAPTLLTQSDPDMDLCATVASGARAHVRLINAELIKAPEKDVLALVKEAVRASWIYTRNELYELRTDLFAQGEKYSDETRKRDAGILVKLCERRGMSNATISRWAGYSGSHGPDDLERLTNGNCRYPRKRVALLLLHMSRAPPLQSEEAKCAADEVRKRWSRRLQSARATSCTAAAAAAADSREPFADGGKK